MMQPSQVQIDLLSGAFPDNSKPTQRRLRDMAAYFSDAKAVSELMASDADRLIYEYFAADLPEEAGQVLYGTTVIYPGRIGSEYHMTKGHFHENRDRAEVYLGLAGEGMLLLQTETGNIQSVSMKAGTVAYVPPFWAHRTINTGKERFVFFAAWPGDAGHDYITIEQRGFSQLVIEQDGKPALVANPRFLRA